MGVERGPTKYPLMPFQVPPGTSLSWQRPSLKRAWAGGPGPPGHSAQISLGHHRLDNPSILHLQLGQNCPDRGTAITFSNILGNNAHFTKAKAASNDSRGINNTSMDAMPIGRVALRPHGEQWHVHIRRAARMVLMMTRHMHLHEVLEAVCTWLEQLRT
jgi:hypothetical protein